VTLPAGLLAVSRLDQAGREEWGDLETVARSVNMDQDFASFLSWASSGNLLPPDFMFQEPTQGRGVQFIWIKSSNT
jgi:hypothetical protein